MRGCQVITDQEKRERARKQMLTTMGPGRPGIKKNTPEEINTKKSRYNALKKQLEIRTNDDLDNQIEIIKILIEIQKKELFKIDNIETFNDFLIKYKKGRTQMYRYKCICNGINAGILSITKVKEIGFKQSEKIIKSDKNYSSFTGERNPTRQTKSQKSKKQTSLKFEKKAGVYIEFPEKYKKIYDDNRDFIKKRIIKLLRKLSDK